MRHINEWNLFKKREKEDTLYRKVGYAEMESFITDRKSEELSDEETKLLSKNKCRHICQNLADDGTRLGIRFFQKYKYCCLDKFEDEYFILYTLSERSQFRPQGIEKYYICDTFEGVIQALKENK